MSTAPAAVKTGRATARAPRPPAAALARRAVARLTMPVLLLLPALVIIVGLVGYPLVRTVYLSFTDTGLGELIYGGSTLVGLDNFKEVFSDEHLRASEERGELCGSVDDHAQRTPVRRAGQPEDIANACSFLVSDEAGYVTGQVIGVNGGRNT